MRKEKMASPTPAPAAAANTPPPPTPAPEAAASPTSPPPPAPPAPDAPASPPPPPPPATAAPVPPAAAPQKSVADAAQADAAPPGDAQQPASHSSDTVKSSTPPGDSSKAPSSLADASKPAPTPDVVPSKPAPSELPVDPPPLPGNSLPPSADAAGTTTTPNAPATEAPKADAPAPDTKGKNKEGEKVVVPEVSSSNLGLPTLLITGDTLSRGLKRQQDADYADENENPWVAVKKQPPMATTGTRLLRLARNPEANRRELERKRKSRDVFLKVQGKLEQVGQKMKNINHEFLAMDPLLFGDTKAPSPNPNHILAGDRSTATGAQEVMDERYKMKEPLKCALLFTNCTDNFTIEDPPDDPHQVLSRYEVNRFLSHHGLPPFKPETYRYTFLPGCSEIGFGAPDDHWERHADCVIVLRPRDYNVIKSKSNALKQLNTNLLNLELDQVRHLEASRRFMEAFFYAKSHGVKNDNELLADLIVHLERELREKSENVTLKEKEVVEKAATIQMLEAQLRSKIHALDQCTTSLHQSEDRNRWIEHKYDVVSASMFKIWVRTLLERVRKRMADDLRPFNNVIRFSRDNHNNMTNWHVTLADLRNQPEACWLLADRGLDETVVELTRMNTTKSNVYTLHQLANIAAHSARDEEIAEAITSKTMEQYREALEKLFRYARGSDVKIEELKNEI